MKARSILAACFFFALLFAVAQAGAATYWVNSAASSQHCTNSSSDPGSGSSSKTIAQGISCMSGGDTLNIRAGTYTENIADSQFSGKSGSSYRAATTIRAYPTDAVTVNGNIQFNAAAGVNTSFIIFQGDSTAKNFAINGTAQFGQAGN